VNITRFFVFVQPRQTHVSAQAPCRDPTVLSSSRKSAAAAFTFSITQSGLLSFTSRAVRISLACSGVSLTINQGSTAMQCPPTPGPGWRIFTLKINCGPSCWWYKSVVNIGMNGTCVKIHPVSVLCRAFFG